MDYLTETPAMHRFIAMLAVCSLILCAGCETTDGAAKAAKIAPKPKARLAVMFYPYDADDERIANPQPRYAGLTARRMRMDAAGLAKSPFDIVIVRLSPETCKNAERVGRCRDLIKALAQGGMPKVVLQLDAESLSELEMKALLEALLDGGHLDASPGYMRVAGEPVILFHSGSGKTVEKDFIGLKLDYDVSKWRRVYAGSGGIQDGKVKWIDRRNARRLNGVLNDADQSGAMVIVVESWNDYRTGSFVEWNSLDQDAMLKALQEWKSSP